MKTQDALDKLANERGKIGEESVFSCPDHAGRRLIVTPDGQRCPVDYAAFQIKGLGLVRVEADA